MARRQEVTHSFKLKLEESQVVLSFFNDNFPDQITRKTAGFVAALLSSGPRSDHEVAVRYTNEDGQEMHSYETRRNGEYHGVLEIAGTTPASISRAKINFTLQVETNWRNGELSSSARWISEALPAGSLRSWVFGETEIDDETLKAVKESLVEVEKECREDSNVFFPVSRESVGWTAKNNDHLLNRMALEVGALIGREVEVHAHWKKSQRNSSDSKKKSATASKKSTSTHDFSGRSSGSEFSLKEQMSSIGIKSVDDLYTKLSKAKKKGPELGKLADSLASISEDDDLVCVLARLMYACSYVPGISVSEEINGLSASLELAGIRSPDDKRVALAAVRVVVQGIQMARENRLGNTCINALALIGEIWANDLPDGMKSAGGTQGRGWVSAAVLLYLAEVVGSSKEAAEVVAESLQGGNAPSFREQVRMLGHFGRAYAEVNGIDYDKFVERHVGGW